MSARIITLTGTPYPKAEIQSVDAGNGVATFRWLDAGGNSVDSGGSRATFTPLAPIEPENLGDPVTYPDVDDATLQAAIENPPPADLGRWRVLKDTLWMRAKELGFQVAVTTAITGLPAANRMDFDCQTWFWSDNDPIRVVLEGVGCTAEDIATIMGPDPLAP